jgi:Flp pilus assembly protein TadG
MNRRVPPNTSFHLRRRERGQTIVLVAVTLVTLLAMAALAIDVVTLYVARGEMQRAADAAALAGAKAFVDSGITPLPTTDPGYPARQILAQNMASAIVNSILPQNKVSGAPPVLVGGAPAFDFTRPGNPQITVTLQRTDLPTFFSRIWGRQLATVTASAVAEAYNASNSQTSAGNYVPITPKCVKPLLLANKDPVSSLQFVDPASGLQVAPNLTGEAVTLTQACTMVGPGTCQPGNLPANPPPAGSFLAAQVTPNANNLCPACQGVTDFEHSVECCDFNPYTCGGAVTNANVDLAIDQLQFSNNTNNGVQCLINKPSQDTLDPTDLISSTGPARITASSGPQSGNLVTTSRSIATLPIIDTTNPIPATGQVRVIGFLQVFIDDVAQVGGNAQIQAHILNVVGCGNNPGAGAPVSGGGMTPIPVRLIH